MSLPRIYMDSCCFIEAVRKDVNDPLHHDENDVWFIKQCLKAAKDGDIEVLSSILTIAESRRAAGQPTEEVMRLYNSILTSGRVVKLARLTQGIAERARDLHWIYGINLSGADAIHVATAMTLKCSEFLTFDAKRKSPFTYNSCYAGK